MAFLSPGYLAGLLFALLPILLHLVHRRRQSTILFSDLRFLRRAERQRSRRLRIREWLLLLVRMLMLALLSLAFARPVIQVPLPSGWGGAMHGKGALAVVLDDSYSMGARPGEALSLWEEAKGRALEALERVHPGSEVLIVLASDRPAVLTPEPIREPGRAQRLIQEATLSERRTDLPSSLAKAGDLLSQAHSPAKEMLVISDFQRGALGPTGPFPIASDVALTLVLLRGHERTIPNAALTLARPQSRLLAKGKEVTIEVQGKRFHSPQQENLSLELWLGRQKVQEGGASFVPGDSVPTATTSLRIKAPSSGLHEAVVSAEPDRLPLDDRRSLVLNVPDAVNVLLLTDRSGPGRSAFYVAKALAPEPGTPFTVKTISPQALSGADPKAFGAVVLSDAALLTEAQLSRIESFVKQGGGLLIIPGAHTDPGYYTRIVLPRLLPMELGAPEQAPEGSSFSIAQFDPEHPAFRLFSRASRGDLSLAKFFQIHPCRPGQGTMVVARFSNGGGAVLERALGKGKVVALGFSLEPPATDLPLKAVFVPLLHQLLLYLSTQPGPMEADYLVGQDVERALPSFAAGAPKALTLVGPDGSRSYLGAKVLGGQSWVSIPQVDKAGIYRILTGDKTLDAFAVNPDTRESDLARMSAEELKGAFPKARIVFPGQSLSALQAPSGGGREIWKLLVLAIVLLALGEMALRERPKKGFLPWNKEA